MKKLLLYLLFIVPFGAGAAAPPPANDNFTNATVLVSSGSLSIQDRNASATTQLLEPTISGKVVSRSIWYSWTAPFTGPVTISTAGSSFDTLLGVFTGTALGSLTSVAENDDAGTGAYTSRVTFNAIGGIPYVILIGGYNGAGGKVLLTITVSGTGPCSYTVTPTSKSFSNLAGTGTETVTTAAGCSWSAMSNDSFLAITTDSTITGSGTVSYSIAANTAFTARTGTLTVAGTTITISQAAAPACTYSLSPTSLNISGNSTTNTLSITTGATCTWTAVPNAAWITIPSGASGTNSGTITYVVATNTTSSTRVGTITAAGQTFTLTQAGTISCTYSISPASVSIVAAGASGNVNITTLTGCPWTASTNQSWTSISTTNGTGNSTVSYTVNANTGPFRTGTLTIAGQTFTISQAAGTCSYAIAPSSISVLATNGSSTVTVATSSGCTWTAVSNDSWLTITSGTSGTGSGSVIYSILANPNTTSRIGTLTIAGFTFTVTQAAAACSYTITPTAAHYLSASSSGNISVTAGTGCAWMAVSNDAFITINSGTPGSGNGTVNYTVGANSTTVSRTGTLTIAGKTFTVTQDGTVPCAYSISPSSSSFTSTGGTSSLFVTSNTGCTWSVSSSDPTWLTFTPSSGSGNGTVTYTVGANISSLTRTGTLTVAGQVLTVTQTGVPCVYGIVPTSSSFSSNGGIGSVSVTATAGCGWTSSSDSSWLVVTSGASGVGNGTVGYSVTNNTSSLTRSGRLTIAGKLLIVTQTGIPCTYSISPGSLAIDNPGGSGTVGITTSDSACSWTASTSFSWLSVFPSTGTGNGSVTYTVSPTTLATSRTGSILIAGQTFTVVQDGDTTAPSVTLTLPANGTTVSNIITLTATATDDTSVSRIEFYQGAGTLLGTDLTSPYTVPFQTTNLANGSYTFYARGFDPANNQGFSSTNTVTISNSVSSNTNTWAQKFGGTGTDVGNAVAVDSSGGIYLAATFSGTITVSTNTFVSAGGRDILLAKFSSAGTHQWSFGFGSTGDEFPISIALDSSNNIYLGGYFSGSGNFGGATLVSAGGLDFWLAKYNSSGVHQWSERFGGTTDEAITSITLDLNQTNVLATGHFQGTVNFGPVTLSSADTGTDTFLSKYVSSSGAPVWAKSFSNRGYDTGISVMTDSTDNVILGGYFSTRIDLGNGILLGSGTNGQADIYLAKYPVSSTAPTTNIWQKRYGAGNSELMVSASIDSSGDIVCAGTFQGFTDLGGGNITGTSIGNDMFVAKYSGSTGNFTWQKGLLCTQGGSPSSLAFSSTKEPVVYGSFFGGVNFGTSSVSSVGSQDIFAAKFTSAGSLLWSRSFGGTGGDSGSYITLDSNNYPVATGSFAGSASFSGTTLVSAGLGDIFLMRIAQ